MSGRSLRSTVPPYSDYAVYDIDGSLTRFTPDVEQSDSYVDGKLQSIAWGYGSNPPVIVEQSVTLLRPRLLHPWTAGSDILWDRQLANAHLMHELVKRGVLAAKAPTSPHVTVTFHADDPVGYAICDWVAGVQHDEVRR